ncbi:MAG: alkaline phosphatase family protein [Isosphaeraceae bacterium]|nr:alkaline phosphatase family protein [Isosphaeraceae bacterium]
MNERLLILGLDGATWSVLDPMRERGFMPNLDALLRRSASGTLRSTIPPMTSAAWTTLMTGCGPARHGVFDHRYFDMAANRMKVNHAGRIRVPTFWKLLSDSGRTVVSLNVPVTYPPTPVRGIMVSGIDAPHLEGAISGCPEFGKRLRSEVPNYHIRALWKRPPRDAAEMAENVRLTVELHQARADAANLADEMASDWSVLMVQFQNLDPFQHRAWRYLNVDETGIEHPEMNRLAGEAMRGLDTAIGRLCELADKRNAGILVASDHGFGSCLGRVHVNRILADAGVARFPGVVGRLRRRVRQGIDHLRTYLAKRKDPEARSAVFEHSIRAQYPFDWKRTLAFAPHQDTAAMVYLNSSMRRKGAPLETPRQVEEAREAAIAALSEAMHPEKGTRLFPKIVSVAESYGVDPAREGYPDLVALPDEEYWVRTKLAPGTAWVEADDNLPGTHRPEGIVVVAGNGVEPGRRIEAHLNDICPTVLNWMGMPIPGHVEGSPLDCLDVSKRYRRDEPSAQPSGPHDAGFEYSAEEQAIIEQRLADLGYLE